MSEDKSLEEIILQTVRRVLLETFSLMPAKVEKYNKDQQKANVS